MTIREKGIWMHTVINLLRQLQHYVGVRSTKTVVKICMYVFELKNFFLQIILNNSNSQSIYSIHTTTVLQVVLHILGPELNRVPDSS